MLKYENENAETLTEDIPGLDAEVEETGDVAAGEPDNDGNIEIPEEIQPKEEFGDTVEAAVEEDEIDEDAFVDDSVVESSDEAATADDDGGFPEPEPVDDGDLKPEPIVEVEVTEPETTVEENELSSDEVVSDIEASDDAEITTETEVEESAPEATNVDDINLTPTDSEVPEGTEDEAGNDFVEDPL